LPLDPVTTPPAQIAVTAVSGQWVLSAMI